MSFFSRRDGLFSFAEIARLIAPNDAPTWLPAHLEWSSQGVRYERAVDELNPSTLEARNRLSEIVKAAKLLEQELSNPVIRGLLRLAGFGRYGSFSLWHLRHLATLGEVAFYLPQLLSSDGKTKRGQGKPKVPDVFDARTLCAARIIEMWRFFRKEVPGVGNLEAARAAQAFWVACGGKTKGYGNPLNGWWDYFAAVQEHSGSPGLKQLIWWRELEQAARRKGPPWCLGTYNPVQRAEITSPIPT